MKITFIGLGNMGIPIAQNLLNAGHTLHIYNRSKAKAESLQGNFTLFDTPKAAVEGQDVVFTMLANDHALTEVTSGEHGFLNAMKKGALHISLSTISAELAKDLAKMHAQSGSLYLASPVFGRPNAAADAKLFICISGSPEAKEMATPLLEIIGQAVYDFGEQVQNANVLKLTGNFMIMAAMEMMAEAFTLAEKQGLDREQVADFFGNTLFNAPIYKNYGTLIAKNNYQPVGFKAVLGLKDARLASKIADEVNMPAPILNLVYNRLSSAVAKGNGDRDWAEGIAAGVNEEAGIGTKSS